MDLIQNHPYWILFFMFVAMGLMLICLMFIAAIISASKQDLIMERIDKIKVGDDL